MTNYLITELIGGLGNRLFLIASGFGLSKLFNKEYVISKDMIQSNKHSELDYSYFYRNIPLIDTIPHNSHHIHEISGLHHTHYMHTSPDFQNYKDIIIHGYLQVYKYFKDYQDTIREWFGPSLHTITELNNKYSNLDECMAIHVRRGDYLGVYIHNVNLYNYYKKSIEMVTNKYGPNTKFLVFSDDVSWSKEFFLSNFNNLNIQFVENENEMNSLWLMSLCKLGIITANSSFSWWAAFLNPNPDKYVIMPNKWFNNDWNVQDIYPDYANIVSVD